MSQFTARTSWRARVKHSDQWWAVWLRRIVIGLRYWNAPTFVWLHRPLLVMHLLIKQTWQHFWQALYFTPLFKSRLQNPPKQMQLYSGMPQILGTLQLRIGEQCRISGVSSFFGRHSASGEAQCVIGHNVDIGWQNTIAVGRRVIIDDNVRLAGRCYLAGFPGHPEDPEARAAGAPDHDYQVGDIHLCRNVWLASGVTVLAGVTIGENSIIAAGSVVTRDIPANVVAAGVPAKVIRPIQRDVEVSL